MEAFVQQAVLALISSFVIGYLLIHFFMKHSHSLGLLDRPNIRKVHHEATPLIGGISIFISFGISVFLTPLARETLQLLSTSVGMVVIIFFMAVLDDRFNLDARLRLLIQVAAATIIAYSGIRIESMHGFLGLMNIPENLQYLLTIIVIVGLSNAFNLIDGIDGLAGSIASVCMLILGFISLWTMNLGLAIICFSMVSALFIFLRFNLHPARIFMGDAGSMTLGFLIAVISIHLLQQAGNLGEGQFYLLVISAFLIVPVVDALRVFLKRYTIRRSIFKADKTHLHHLALLQGWNHRKVSRAITLLQLLLVGLALILYPMLGPTISIIALVFIQLLISKLLMLDKQVRDWQEKMYRKENQLIG